MREGILPSSQCPISWPKMARLLQRLNDFHGKSGGCFSLVFDMYDGGGLPAIYLKFWGYELGPLARNEEAGPFYTERAAFDYCVGLMEFILVVMRENARYGMSEYGSQNRKNHEKRFNELIEYDIVSFLS